MRGWITKNISKHISLEKEKILIYFVENRIKIYIPC